jgi:hypothetical protein
MSAAESHSNENLFPAQSCFATTHWSVVLNVGQVAPRQKPPKPWNNSAAITGIRFMLTFAETVMTLRMPRI